MKTPRTKLRWSRLTLLAVLLPPLAPPVAAQAGAGIPWQDWSDAVFAQARREDRLVLLDLGAVWCHWCHVMEETTYKDPKVIALVRARYLPVRVDQDARPDLSNRYEDYGWPATVVFDADGRELVKFAGYIPPQRMISLLEATVEDPTPGPSVRPETPAPPDTRDAALSAALRSELLQLLANRYDVEQGGWGFAKKYLDWDAVEYSMLRAREGDLEAEKRARETLARQLKLVDPVWGGVYQYSHGGNWDNPHFEKIMAFQAENLRTYAQGHAQWGNPEYLQAARDIHRYLRAFLKSPEGAFYASQNADLVDAEHGGEYFALPDAERRKRGLPRVDTRLYTRETAWAVHGLTALYGVTGEEQILAEASHAASWILENRALPDGGFRHDAVDRGGPYLGDTLAAGRAFLSLYAATGERAWLARAEQAAAFIGRFRQAGAAGFVTSAPTGPLPARAQRDENVVLARFANLLHRYTGQPSHRGLALHALRYLSSPEVAMRFETGGVLLADREVGSEPLHVTVVGARQDADARRLLRVALADPASYKRVELWDRRDGPLPYADVEYPALARPAAFLCSASRCSAPAFTVDQLRARLAKAAAPTQGPSAPLRPPRSLHVLLSQ